MKPHVWQRTLTPILAALLVLAGAPAQAQEIGCDDPQQILVIEPLNPINGITGSGFTPPAVAADGSVSKGTFFKFGLVVVTYENGRAVPHGCDPTTGSCQDLASVVGSLRWETILFPGASGAAGSPLNQTLGSHGPVCFTTRDLRLGPPVSVNVKGPASGPTEIPPFTFVPSALLAVPASAISPNPGGSVGVAKVTSWGAGVSDCGASGSLPPEAFGIYTPATKATAYDRELACSVSHGAPSAVLFVRNVDQVEP